MKIKQHEYDDLISILDEFGFGQNELQFVKRKGWFFIEFEKNIPSFSFHRRKESILLKGEFKELLNYRCRIEKETFEVGGWEEVLEKFRHLLSDL